MVVLSERYLPKLEKDAIELALTFGIAPKTFRQSDDDSVPDLEAEIILLNF